MTATPVNYLSKSPGAQNNDTKILAENTSDTSTVTTSPTPVTSPSPSTGAIQVKVMTYNLHHGGEGTDGIYNTARQASVIAKEGADILCTTESNSSGPAMKAALESKTGKTWYMVTTSKNSIFSRYPIVSSKLKPLTDYDCDTRSVQQASVSVSGKTLNVFCAHIDTSFGGCSCATSTRLSEISELKSFAQGFPEPRVFGGDFNFRPASTEYNALVGSSGGVLEDTWRTAMGTGTATSYGPCNAVSDGTRTHGKGSRIDYLLVTPNSTSVKSTRIPDTRNLSDTNVNLKVGNCDDDGVRPSDHNPMSAIIELN
jgi:endonuclease/exonuclease/phosphatase family metal-dependent hydrolase